MREVLESDGVPREYAQIVNSRGVDEAYSSLLATTRARLRDPEATESDLRASLETFPTYREFMERKLVFSEAMSSVERASVVDSLTQTLGAENLGDIATEVRELADAPNIRNDSVYNSLSQVFFDTIFITYGIDEEMQARERER